jgi:hypothetical protein
MQETIKGMIKGKKGSKWIVNKKAFIQNNKTKKGRIKETKEEILGLLNVFILHFVSFILFFFFFFSF